MSRQGLLQWEGAGTCEKLAEAQCGCNREQRGTHTGASEKFEH